MIKYETHVLLPGYETNTYLVWDTESLEAMLIDPSAPSQALRDEIIAKNLKLNRIINTHGHGDHIGGNEYFHKEFKCPIGIHNFDSEMLYSSTLNLSYFMSMDVQSPIAGFLLNEVNEFYLGSYLVKIIHTPGHTRGGVVIYTEPYLFSGDTLFYLDVGRTDLPGGDMKQLIESIKNKIFTLPDETIVLPGHGPSSNIKKEKYNNPYIN